MFFLGVAVDYDGTIAQHGSVDADTLAALERIRASGRRLVLVTGRQLEAITAAFPHYRMFDRLVLENGAVLHDPAEDRTEVLSAPPDVRLVDLLRRRATVPIEVGRSIVAGWEPDQAVFLEAVHTLGLEVQLIFNKGALMLLPTGVNKASGLRAAAKEMGVKPSALVGMGDAENDHSFLSICGCSCAVSNAVASLKAEVDLVAPNDHGAGVQWLADRLLALDSAMVPGDRHGLPIGTSSEGAVIRLLAHQGNVLVVGPSGTGKSSLVALICEAAWRGGLGFSAIDPEGDYPRLQGASVLDLGRPGTAMDEYDTLLAAEINPVVLLRGVEASKRADFIRSAIQMAVASNARGGHPAYLVVDEAHEGLGSANALPDAGGPCIVLATLSPRLISAEALETIWTIIAFGADALALVAEFCAMTDTPMPDLGRNAPLPMALIWRRGGVLTGFVPHSPQRRHVRHAGKYATGDVGRERSFYFRGRHNTHLVAAKNLYEFIEAARRLPTDVWSHHLRTGDVSRWFRGVVRDDRLADLADALARAERHDPAESLSQLSGLITERYCVPTEANAENTVLD